MKTNAAELEHILQKSHAEKTNLETALADSLSKIEQQNRQRESDNHLQQVCNNQLIKVSNGSIILLHFVFTCMYILNPIKSIIAKNDIIYMSYMQMHIVALILSILLFFCEL